MCCVCVCMFVYSCSIDKATDESVQSVERAAESMFFFLCLIFIILPLSVCAARFCLTAEHNRQDVTYTIFQ